MAKYNHETHKYFRARFEKSGTAIYRCGLPGCTHFVYQPMILNRLSICWRCGERFVITSKSLRSKKFHCEDCTKGNQLVSREIKDDLDKLLIETGLISHERLEGANDDESQSDK